MQSCCSSLPRLSFCDGEVRVLLFSQVHLLRNAGDEVTITVDYLREAPSFLKLPLGKWEGGRPEMA
jgi:hypothetical protein